MAGNTDYNAAKLRELILYIAERCEEDPTFGATKLNKILYYSDFLAYANDGQSITGADYQRLPNGPAVQQMLPILQELVDDGAAVEVTRERYGYRQRRLVSLGGPRNLAAFSGAEIARVDKVISDFWGLSAAEVSERSHREMGWKLAYDGQEIPYQTVFLSMDGPTSSDREWAESIAEARGLLASA